MYDHDYPIRLDKPIIPLEFNENKNWWEGKLGEQPIVLWTDLNKEKRALYYHCFKLKEDGSLGQKESATGILFSMSGTAINFSEDEEEQDYFKLPYESVVYGIEHIYSCPILFWFFGYPGELRCIPARPELLNDISLTKEEEERLQQRMEQYHAEKEQENRLKEQQVQDQKEQTEKEWEEWEKRQSEENDK